MKKNKIFYFLFFLCLFSFAQEPNAPEKPAQCKLSNTPFGKFIDKNKTKLLEKVLSKHRGISI